MAETIVDALFNLLAVVCGLLVLYGGWISLRYGSINEDASGKNRSTPGGSHSAPVRGKDAVGFVHPADQPRPGGLGMTQ